jgi:hypothetical protein
LRDNTGPRLRAPEVGAGAVTENGGGGVAGVIGTEEGRAGEDGGKVGEGAAGEGEGGDGEDDIEEDVHCQVIKRVRPCSHVPDTMGALV